ncbi:HNH endonuclease [Derxia gummosa]|uniref:HNH endonuclease n=1 Tax=Derxia gummosa DSM 723 TaxID=1121388 RepID=A0A8B6X7E8_9BURK|nr:HNH endonuclease signature motif containing protein [Derxia gummosa]
MKLTTLKPSLRPAPSGLRLAAAPDPIGTERMRGRRAVEARARYLRLHPLCVACGSAGAVTVATEVDHVVPLALGGSDTDANKQALCGECHRGKTKRDLAEIAAQRGA